MFLFDLNELEMIRRTHPSFFTLLVLVRCLAGTIAAAGSAEKKANVPKRTSPSAPLAVIHLDKDQLLQFYPEDLGGVAFSPDQSGTAAILAKVGERVESFFHNYPNTTSKEDVLLERLTAKGEVQDSLRQIYDYMVRVCAIDAGLGLEEERGENQTKHVKYKKVKEYCLTSGYVGTLVLFHPVRQPDSMYRYLGKQTSAPHSHVLAFAQKPAARYAIGAFRASGNSPPAPMLYQGLVWIDPQTYQIRKLRADLLAPLESVKLASHSTELSFSEVRFRDIPESFWVPQKVLVTLSWKGKHYRNLHRYSDYRVFTVRSFDSIQLPKPRTAKTSKTAKKIFYGFAGFVALVVLSSGRMTPVSSSTTG